MFYLINLPSNDQHELFYDPMLEADAKLWPGSGANLVSSARRLLQRTLLSGNSEEQGDQQDGLAPSAPVEVNEGFSTPVETLTSAYRLMLGDFERDWFDQPLTLLMFFAYTFIANIMMLNMLIAVVSDSYECAIIKSKLLFRRARLELVAEFDTMITIWRGSMGGVRAGPGGAYAELQQVERAAVETPSSSWVWRTLAHAIKMGGGDDEGGDEWQGRTLDMEKRIVALIGASETRANVELDARLTASEVRIIDAVRRLHRGQG